MNSTRHRCRLFVLCFLTAACTRSPAAPASRAAAANGSNSRAPAGAVPGEPTLTVEAPGRSVLLADGEPVPTFRAITHDGQHVDVGSWPRTRVLVLYFYPRDETAG